MLGPWPPHSPCRDRPFRYHTALVTVLAAHPAVVVGVERFKKLWGDRIDEHTPDLLAEREKFFDFEGGLTSLTRPGPRLRAVRQSDRRQAD